MKKDFFTDTGYIPARLYSITRVYINMGDIEKKLNIILLKWINTKNAKVVHMEICYEKFALMGMLAEAREI